MSTIGAVGGSHCRRESLYVDHRSCMSTIGAVGRSHCRRESLYIEHRSLLGKYCSHCSGFLEAVAAGGDHYTSTIVVCCGSIEAIVQG